MRAINLLPPEEFEKGARRRQFIKLALAGLAYVAVLGLLVMWWQGRVGAAEDDIAAQEEINQRLTAQVRELADVEQLVGEYDSNVTLLTSALATDLAWGRILNDLGRVIPDRVWLESFAAATAFTAETGALGTVSVSGIAFDFPDVSAWLRSLDSDRFPSVNGTWVQSVSNISIGDDPGIPAVSFTSTTSLTPAAISSRLVERIPLIAP